MQCLGTGMQTKRPGSRDRCKAAAAAEEKPQVHLLGWDPAAQLCKAALFQTCATASPSRRMARSSCIWGWAVVEASFRLWSKEGRAESGSQNLPRYSWVPGTQNGDGRQQSWGIRGTECHNKRSSTLLSKTSGWYFKCNAKSLAKQSSPGAACLERPSVFFLFPTFNNCQCLTFLFSFLMCLLNPISIQEPWLIEKKPNP